MRRRRKQGIEWLEFELLAQYPEVRHGVFLRQGGVSTGCFASLNIGGASGDLPEHVATNREKARISLGLSALISRTQKHGSQIAHISSATDEETEADGLMTQQKQLGLLIKHADCQAALFFDPVQRAVAALHVGWRGLVQNVYRTLVAQMHRSFGTQASDLLVGISPSLGPEHAQFVHYKEEFPPSFWPYQTKPHYFDLWSIATQQLLECGLLAKHIEIARICTFSHPEEYFSYRRERVTGRHGSVIALIENCHFR